MTGQFAGLHERIQPGFDGAAAFAGQRFDLGRRDAPVFLQDVFKVKTHHAKKPVRLGRRRRDRVRAGQ